MRPKYGTPSIVLARTPLAEASALLYLLTEDFGLLKARAQGLRKSGAKLAPALQTLTESDVMLVRGKDAWRLSGAILAKDWPRTLSASARARAGRTARLLLRLVHGESTDTELFSIFKGFLEALPTLSEAQADAAEHLVALRLLRELGLDAGEIPSGYESLENGETQKRDLIIRINRGIAASGL
jgi:DNA repair protein RecO